MVGLMWWIGQELKLFADMLHELSVECGCLFRGNRVNVPACLQKKVVNLLHDGHPGVVKMQSLAHNMYGGQVLTRHWNAMCRVALCARKTANHPKWHLCTPGNGRISHGPVSMLIMLAPFWDTCS